MFQVRILVWAWKFSARSMNSSRSIFFIFFSLLFSGFRNLDGVVGVDKCNDYMLFCVLCSLRLVVW